MIYILKFSESEMTQYLAQRGFEVKNMAARKDADQPFRPIAMVFQEDIREYMKSAKSVS